MNSNKRNLHPKRVVVLHGGVSLLDSNMAVSTCKNVIKHSDDAVQAVENLEKSGAFNAGRGSSLTREGTLEMEAAVMKLDDDGQYLFGGVGCVELLDSPIRTAEAIAESTKEVDENCLIDPMVLVGKGAEKWARDNGLGVVEKAFISQSSINEWKRAIKIIGENKPQELSHPVMDTVGAVDVDIANFSSTVACSSGGISFKRCGRLGHCTVFGAGTWIETKEWQENDYSYRRSVSISLSGCGEAIVRLNAAREIAKMIFERSDNTLIPTVICSFYDTLFHKGNKMVGRIDSRHLFIGGVAIVREDKTKLNLAESEEEETENSIDIVFFHDTPFMPIAWRDARGKIKAIISRRDGTSDSLVVTVIPVI